MRSVDSPIPVPGPRRSFLRRGAGSSVAAMLLAFGWGAALVVSRLARPLALRRTRALERLRAQAIDLVAGQTDLAMAGRLPAPERASRDELERAEKTHKRLVAWRWLALRFPNAYVARDEANGETERLDRWIEDVLRQQRRSKLVA